MTDKELREIIRETVREVLREERLSLYELLVPYVTAKELKEIEDRFGTPAEFDENEFEDLTEWVKGQ
ncbi:MAG: hypothetical protein D6732_20315 [Methanobacteriota archaeon]|nr:MAG: hypothetical protein D6732_20315 [Euryarchaeota archaeon]